MIHVTIDTNEILSQILIVGIYCMIEFDIVIGKID